MSGNTITHSYHFQVNIKHAFTTKKLQKPRCLRMFFPKEASLFGGYSVDCIVLCKGRKHKERLFAIQIVMLR